VFHHEGDYHALAQLLAEPATPFPQRILTFCVMPNYPRQPSVNRDRATGHAFAPCTGAPRSGRWGVLTPTAAHSRLEYTLRSPGPLADANLRSPYSVRITG
jgi:hypothetical protein